MKHFSRNYFDNLIRQAKANIRLRQHQNIHESYDDPCQKLFNVIELGSYIRPHRHLSDPRSELLIAISGLLALIIFSDEGEIKSVSYLGTEQYKNVDNVGVEIPSNIWHTVIALVPSSILLEVKAGPFDSTRPKDLASWAPAEESDQKDTYQKYLFDYAVNKLNN